VRYGEEGGRATTRDVVLRRMIQVDRGSAGLPLAVQVVARPWREHVAIAAMRVIEAAARASVEDYPWTPTAVARPGEGEGWDPIER
jgi:fatty acid amide hydrolase